MHLLQDSNVRNVVVIVSRWFGGMLLGPARFMYITDAARGMLSQGGYLQQPKPVALTRSAPNAVPLEESSSSEEEAEVLACCKPCFLNSAFFCEASARIFRSWSHTSRGCPKHVPMQL